MFSATSAAAVTCAIMKPELRPGFGVRNAGRPESAGSTSIAIRRSASEPISQIGERDHVGGEGDGLGVEIAARKRLVRFREDERIVGDAVGLGEERRGRLAQEIEAGAHHLRLAAQAIGILHPFVAGQVRGADGASLKQRAQRRGDFDLAGMAPQRMDARIERRVRSARAVGRQRAGRKRRAEQRLGLEQADQRIGGRELRAVEQREPLLGLKRDRLEAGFGERGGGGRDAVADASLAHADHRRRHMRERREIARRADRTLRRDDGRHVRARASPR